MPYRTKCTYRDCRPSRVWLACAFFALAAACTPAAAPSHPVGDAGDLPAEDPTSCAPACVKLRELGCREGGDSAAGESCETLCVRVVTTSEMPLPIACVAKASSVAEVRSCGVRCKNVGAPAACPSPSTNGPT